MNSICFIKRLSKAKQPFDILRFSILRFCGSLLKTLNPEPQLSYQLLKFKTFAEYVKQQRIDIINFIFLNHPDQVAV